MGPFPSPLISTSFPLKFTLSLKISELVFSEEFSEFILWLKYFKLVPKSI